MDFGPSLKINLTQEMFNLCLDQRISDMSQITNQPRLEVKYRCNRSFYEGWFENVWGEEVSFVTANHIYRAHFHSDRVTWQGVLQAGVFVIEAFWVRRYCGLAVTLPRFYCGYILFVGSGTERGSSGWEGNLLSKAGEFWMWGGGVGSKWLKLTDYRCCKLEEPHFLL